MKGCGLSQGTVVLSCNPGTSEALGREIKPLGLAWPFRGEDDQLETHSETKQMEEEVNSTIETQQKANEQRESGWTP